MPILDLVSRLVAGPAGRVVEAPVRDVVDEILRQQPMARPEDVDRLRHEVSDLTGELQRVQERIAALAAAVEALQGQPTGPSMEEIVAAVKAALPTAEAPAAASEEAAVPAKSEAKSKGKGKGKGKKKARAKAKDGGRPGRRSLAHLGCSVEGCEQKHRSKGFCSRHYQQWRRGTLVGFVSPEGLVAAEDGRAFRVDPELSGQAVAVKGTGRQTSVRVDGSKVGFEALD